VGIIASAGLFVWATWPAAGRLDISTRSPKGIPAKLNAIFHGNAFWRVQLADLQDPRHSAESWDQLQAEMQARADAILEHSQSSLNRIYRAHPTLAPTDAQLAARRFRDLADKTAANNALK
jgi:hypothetical protein